MLLQTGFIRKKAGDYIKATALEALYGYLYLDARMDRLMELIKISLNELDIHL